MGHSACRSNVYLEAWREWDDRYADLVQGKRNWQIVTAAFSLLSLILAVGIVWLITRSRYIPYVVEVDKLGYALTVPRPLIREHRARADRAHGALRGRDIHP